MLRLLLLALLALNASARLQGAFVIDDIEEYDQNGDLITQPSTTEASMTNPQTEATSFSSEATTTGASSTTSEATTQSLDDGHDPMEVFEAGIDLLNTPVNKMVGSNPLRRLLRLVGPTRDDFLHSMRITQEIQKASGQKAVDQPVTAWPAVVDQIFGFNESDDQLFHKTTTLAPLFPVVPYDHDAVYKYFNKQTAESTSKTTHAPIPKL